MKILVVNARARNFGDQAIASCMADQLREAFPGCALAFESDEPSRLRAWLPQEKVVPGFVQVEKIRPSGGGYDLAYLAANGWFIAKVIVSYAYAFFAAILPVPSILPIIAAYREADLVVWAGGDYVSSMYGKRIRLRLWELSIAKRMGKPVAVYAQTFGPFAVADRRAAASALGRADLLLARDAISEAALADLGVTRNVRRTADSVLLLRPVVSARVESLSRELGLEQSTVGFSVLDQSYSGTSDAAYAAYLDGMLALMAQAQAAGFRPLFLASTTEDADRARLLQRTHGLAYPLFDLCALPSGETLAVVSRLKAVVSSRMHPIIAATSAGVPCLGINRLPKMKEYLREVGLGTSHLDMEPFDLPAATAKLEALLGDLEAWKRRVQEHLPALREASRRNVDEIRKVLDRSARPRHIVLSTVFLPSTGGKEKSIDALTRMLADAGDPTELVCSRFAYQGDTSAFDASYPVPITRVHDRLSDAVYLWKHRVSRSPATRWLLRLAEVSDAAVSLAVLFPAAFRRARATSGPVILHCHTIGTLLVGFACRVGLGRRVRVVFVNGFVHRKTGNPAVDAMLRFFFKATDACLCVCQASTDALVQDFRLDPAKAITYGNWIDPAPIDALVPPETYLAREYAGPIRVLYFGRIEADKGIPELIAAIGRAAENDDGRYAFTVVGRGDPALMARLDAIAAARPTLLSYPGWVGKPELWNHLAAADLLLLPVRWEEAGANVVLEASVFGLPVIATRRGGLPEKLERFPFHRLLDATDPDAILSAIDSLSSGMRTSGRRAVFVSARESLRAFSPEASKKIYLGACDRLVGYER